LDFCCICSTWDMVLFAGTELSLWDLGFWRCCCLLGQWHSHIPKTWLFSYSNPSTDQLPLVSHAYDFRREVHVEQNILKTETKQWTNWYTFPHFCFFYIYTVPTMCVFTQLTACCWTRWLMFPQLLVAFVIRVNLWHFLHPFTFLCLCISVSMVNQLLFSSSYSCQFIALSDFINFSVS